MTIIGLSIAYGVLALGGFVRHLKRTRKVTRDGLRTPFSELQREQEEVAAAHE